MTTVQFIELSNFKASLANTSNIKLRNILKKCKRNYNASVLVEEQPEEKFRFNCLIEATHEKNSRWRAV